MLKKILFLINYKGIILFINHNSNSVSKISKLLNLSKNDYILLYNIRNNKNLNDTKNYYLTSFMFLLIFYFNFKAKKILFVAQPLYSIPFLLFKNFFLMSYDCHYGLPNSSYFKKILERLSIFFNKSFIHRDLRLWSIYKNLLKSKKNILIPDYSFKNNLNFKTNKNDENKTIDVVVSGWIDDSEVCVTETLYKFLSLGCNIHFYIPDICLNEIKHVIDNLKKNYSNQIFIKKFINNYSFINDISKYHFAICPHSKKNSKINRKYRQNCGSSRIIDYVNAKLIILCSRTAFFQKYIVRSNNGYYLDIFSIENLDSRNDLIFHIDKIKKIRRVVKKKIFDEDYLSVKLINFIR